MMRRPTGIAALMQGPIRPGRVAWIGLRPARRAPLVAVPEVVVLAGRGLEGDRTAMRLNPAGGRHVTLISTESIGAIGAFLGGAEVEPDTLRRNVVTRGINLLALKGRRFRLGSARLEATGECHPCGRMEEALGPGGFNAMRGQGGITARVLEGGVLRLGDAVEPVEADAPASA